MTLPYCRRPIPAGGAARLLVSLAIVLILCLALGNEAPAQAARAHNIVPCLGCSFPSITVTADYAGDLTVAGQNFTPGGLVTIVATMPPDGMGGGGATTVTTQASYPRSFCTPFGCYATAGGSFTTTFGLTFGCGGGMSQVTVQAQDLASRSLSNRVAILPWMNC